MQPDTIPWLSPLKVDNKLIEGPHFRHFVNYGAFGDFAIFSKKCEGSSRFH